MPIYQIGGIHKIESQVICLKKSSENRTAASIIYYNLHISFSELSMRNVMVWCKNDKEVK